MTNIALGTNAIINRQYAKVNYVNMSYRYGSKIM